MKLSSPILTFMLASIGVHAGLVMTSNNLSSIALPGSTGSVMAVKINKPEQVLKNNIEKTSQSKPIAKINKTVPVLKEAGKKIVKKPSSQLPHTTQTSQQAESKARVISIIYKELNQHFIYPKMAQKRNWQGKVLLSLRVSSSGKINNVQVNRSSGYSVLDQAAINSLMKVGNLPQISSWLPYDIDLNIPVIYQLTEG